MPKHYLSYADKILALERKYLGLDLSRNERLKRVSNELSEQLNPKRAWSDKALYRVLAGHKPGRFLGLAIDRLYSQLAKPQRKRRHDKLRVCVPVESEAQRQLINARMTAADKLEALLLWMHME